MYDLVDLLLVAVAILPLGVGIGFGLQRRQRVAALADLARVRVELANEKTECELQIRAAEAEATKRRQVVGVIERVLLERDDWVKRYMQHASEHGNAQSMLMIERDGLIRQLKRLGKTPRLDPRVEAAVQMFSETHLSPAVQANAAAVVASGPAIRVEAGADPAPDAAPGPSLTGTGAA